MFTVIIPRNNRLAPSLNFFGVGLYCCEVLRSRGNLLRAYEARLAFQREDQDAVRSLSTAVYSSTASDNHSTTKLILLAYTAN